MTNLPWEKRETTLLEDVDFGPQVQSRDFRSCRLERVGGKKTCFIKCNFHSAIFKNCYFHQAVFVDCTFTGATILDTNFRSARFENCKFEYVTFRNTSIDVNQILSNLPSWENARRELLRILRKNAESQGDIEDVRRYLKEEMEASAEHWRSAYRQVSSYYVQHYNGFVRRADSFLRFAGIKFSKHFWGYGDSPLRLGIALALWLFLCSIFVQYVDASNGLIVSAAAIFRTCAIFFGTNTGIRDALTGSLLEIGIVASRYVFLGLLTAVLVRRFARR
jgi:hypothetical protein